MVQRSLASSLARATARQQCLLRKESVISGRNVVSIFIDFSYTVPLQRRTSGLTRLSPLYLRILPLNALHIFISTANVTSRTQVGTLYQVSPICWILEDYHGLCRSGESYDDGLSWQGQSSVLIPAFRLHLISC
ncbi:Hypothetical_protein [Hexamita inflata]|uniref:Hypothetical_protein n=1 Tax=Hexamita inflata TaxID=28002 RepID=A0ABP1H6B9_9EUKA